MTEQKAGKVKEEIAALIYAMFIDAPKLDMETISNQSDAAAEAILERFNLKHISDLKEINEALDFLKFKNKRTNR